MRLKVVASSEPLGPRLTPGGSHLLAFPRNRNRTKAAVARISECVCNGHSTAGLVARWRGDVIFLAWRDWVGMGTEGDDKHASKA
jgi:hypothetical protein